MNSANSSQHIRAGGARIAARGKPRARIAGILLGIGLGGFLDGIALHQIMQWHNMLSTVLPPVTIPAMRTNMRADGLFHAMTWVVTVAGVLCLWSAARAREPVPAFREISGWFLTGWGLFNLVEGLIDHQLLGIHHVRGYPSAPWDWGFVLIGGVGLIAVGRWLSSRGDGVPMT